MKSINSNFNIHLYQAKSAEDFVSYWSGKYSYQYESYYINNINRPLNDASRLQLFIWKNGGPISSKKQLSIIRHYPLDYGGDLKNYLSVFCGGGPIWNIFYMHIVDQTWPIFDQHAYRAMTYIEDRTISELPLNKSKVYEIYTDKYVPFIHKMTKNCSFNQREIDKSLFVYGKLLKSLKTYL